MTARYGFLACWIGLIFASSTGIAQIWADSLYLRVVGSSEVLTSASSQAAAQKLLHVTLFAVFGWFLPAYGSRWKSLSACALWSFGIGLASESLQLLFPNRYPTFHDVLLNGCSGILGCLLRLFSKMPAD